MTDFTKSVAGVIPGMMSLSLVGKSAKLVPQLMAKPTDDSLKGKTKPGDFIKGSMDILVGVPLIGAVAGSVAKL